MNGVSAEISGGKFWYGVRNGAISSGLNHAVHMLMDGQDDQPKPKKKEYASQQEYMNDMLLPFNEGLLKVYQFMLEAEAFAAIPFKSFGRLFSKSAPIQFGNDANSMEHAFRHTDKLGLSRNAVKSIVTNHLTKVSGTLAIGKTYNYIVRVNGKYIQYSAYKLPSGTINVGRIHGLTK